MEAAFRLDFLSSDEIRGQGAALFPAATPPAVNNGMTLNGTSQYATIPAAAVYPAFQQGVTNGLTLYVEFRPDFDYNEAVQRVLVDCSAPNRYLIFKEGAAPFNLQFFAGATVNLASISSAAYGQFWRPGQTNRIAAAIVSGANNFYLNGVLIGTSATAWSRVLPAGSMFFGTVAGGGSYFDGVITDFRIYSRQLTADEATALTVVESATYELTGDSVGDGRSTDRRQWEVSDLAASCVLDVDGEDIAAGIAGGTGIVTPAVGPLLDIHGTIVANRPGPWRRLDGTAINGAYFSPGAYLASAADYAVLDRDVVFAALVNTGTTTTHVGQGDPYNVMGLIDAAVANWISVYTQSPYGCHINVHPVFGVQLDMPIIIGVDNVLVSGSVGHGGLVETYCSGVARASGVTPAPAFVDPLRFGIGAGWDGSAPVLKRMIMYRAMWWIGAGIAATANAAWHARLAASATGLWPRAGRSGTYTRGTWPVAQNERCYYPLGRTGRCHIVGFDTPPAGNAAGVGVDEEIVSVATFNHSIPTGAGATDFLVVHIAPGSDAGIVASVVDDSANMSACYDAGPLVVRLQNPTLSAKVQRFSDVLGAAGWVSIRGRTATGTVRLGIHTAGGTFTQGLASLAADYSRSAALVAGGAATDRLAIELSAGADVYVILWCGGTGTRIRDEVPSLQPLGGGTTVPQGIVVTGYTPQNGAETIELTTTPRTNGAVVPTGALRVLSRNPLDMNMLTIGVPGVNTVSTSDNVATASAACHEVDGVTEMFRTAHGGTRLYVAKVGEAAGEAVYGGTLPAWGPLSYRGGYYESTRLMVSCIARFDMLP